MPDPAQALISQQCFTIFEGGGAKGITQLGALKALETTDAVTDPDWKTKEDLLRSQAAEALTYQRPDAAERPAFKRLKIQPNNDDDDLKRSLEEIKDRAMAARRDLA